MTIPPLKTAFWNYDRTNPLLDGRVDLGGLDLRVSILRPEQTFARAYEGDGFDLCEASLSNTVTQTSLDACPYVLIPAFLSRAFRHGAVFVRNDRGIATPGDLTGKIVGVQEYDMTAAVVVRGLLRDEFGVDSASIDWRIGESERLKPLEFPTGRPPDGVSLTLRPPGPTLEEGLLSGELDAIVSLRVPRAVRQADPRVRPLFSRGAESDYFCKTGIFPIMHAVALRREIADSHPGLTRRLYEAFSTAKDLAIADLEIIQAPKVTLPWPHLVLDEVRAAMGQDFWPYGIAGNRKVLETQLRWSAEDGLQARKIAIADVFAADCLDT